MPILPPAPVQDPFSEYRPLLLVIANSMLPAKLRGRIGPSDLVQETFLAAQSEIRKGVDPKDLGSWLCGILKNRIAQAYRDHVLAQKRSVSREEFSPHADCAGSTDPEALASFNEMFKTISQALETLSAEERSIISWKLQENFRWKQIGEKAGLSEEAARKVFSRAMGKLAASLSAYGEPGEGP